MASRRVTAAKTRDKTNNGETPSIRKMEKDKAVTAAE